MSKKINNIRFKGNQHFFGEGTKNQKGNKNIRPLFSENAPSFGTLGNGILRPVKRDFAISQKAPYNFDKKFTPDAHLTEDQKAKRLADKVADSLQQRIDAATAANKKQEDKQSSTTEIKQQEKKSQGASIGFIVMCVGAGALALGMAYAFYTQLDKSKLKTA